MTLALLINLVAAGAPTTVWVARNDEWLNVRVEAISDGGVAWVATLEPGKSVEKLADVGTELRLTAKRRNKGVEKRQVVLPIAPDALAVSVAISSGLNVDTLNSIPPPEGLKVSIGDPDDTTGSGTLRVENQTSNRWNMRAFIDGQPNARGEFCGERSLMVEPFQNFTVSLMRFFAPLPLEAGKKFERHVVFAKGDSRAIVTLPFTATNGTRPTVFPTTRVDFVFAQRLFASNSCVTLEANDELVCACDGMRVGKERARLDVSRECFVLDDGTCVRFSGSRKRAD